MNDLNPPQMPAVEAPTDWRVWLYRSALIFSMLVFVLMEAYELYMHRKVCPSDLVPLPLSLFALILYGVALWLSLGSRNSPALGYSLQIGLTLPLIVLGGIFLIIMPPQEPLVSPAVLLAAQGAVIVFGLLCLPLARARGWRPLSVLALPILTFFALIFSFPSFYLTGVDSTESSAIGSVRLIITCSVGYQTGHPDLGYPSEMTLLGPQSMYGPKADGCIDEVLARASTSEGYLKSGSQFRYTPGEPNREGVVETFTIVSTPEIWGRTGCHSFFGDDTGVVRVTEADRPATIGDPPI